ncbi:MAG: ATP-binding protein [Lachnospiraceae bacterium]|nr:ATP-binding protein [Lachnospiraceae bacterium]
MLIGRENEKNLLRRAFRADRSRFIAVYGRRRVGKTFLIRETFDYTFTFQHAGLAKGKYRDQLNAFADSLREAGAANGAAPKNWMDAFRQLKDLIVKSGDARKVIFIDELSWMDTPRSDLMMALENFWNGFASARKDIVLIICTSATSWILKNVIHDKGGLHNRVTDKLPLQPFNLYECEKFLESKGIVMDRYDILEGYMAMGGVPYYWDFVQSDKSMTQNIDTIFFEKDAQLKGEFDYLYASIFRRPEEYIRIIKALGKKKVGMRREEISRETGLSCNGAFSKRLEELESCGFVRKYHEFGKKNMGAVIQLIDNYTLFYFKFLEKTPTDPKYWEKTIDSPAKRAWMGLAFERVCLQHSEQIRKKLGISGVLTDECAWQCASDPDKGIYGSQIDLVIDRNDRVVNLCEIKYSELYYRITKDYDRKLKEKISDFKNVTRTKSSVHLTVVTTYGLERGKYAGHVQSVVTANDLFQPAGL